MVAQAPLLLQLLRNAFEFSLKLQVRVLPRQLLHPLLSLQPFLTLQLELLRQRPSFFAQQLQSLGLFAQ
jgi:hypothetical protein